MSNHFISLRYKGTHFSGFQKQNNAQTIQGELDKALETVLKKSIETITSSRTDAGVHAYENYVHTHDIPIGQDIEKLKYQLNAILDKDIAVLNIQEVKTDAHSRFNALSRNYVYRIHKHKNPMLNEHSYFYPFALDFDQLEKCANIFLKNKNFKAFSKKHTEVNNFLCQLTICRWNLDNQNELSFEVEGNRFLRGMVRALVATSLQIARGKIPVNELKNIIASEDCKQANFSAVAHGLSLMKVNYPKEIFI